MLGQKNGESHSEVIDDWEPLQWDIDAGYAIEEAESCIDVDDTLYMITWAPDPDELPQADFTTQHSFNVNILSDYLKCCECGIFCVESSQKGNPHYHGWYQTSDDNRMELKRICIVKVLERFGNVKITKSVGHYRINSYTKQGNCLSYYKQDLFGQMQYMKYNPITRDSFDDTDWNMYLLFFDQHKKGFKRSVIDTEKKVSQREFYLDFFTNSKF